MGFNKDAAAKPTAVENGGRTPPADENSGQPDDVWKRFDELLAEIDRIPDVPAWRDPLVWDENGLPM